jgi:hypothetical protein
VGCEAPDVFQGIFQADTLGHAGSAAQAGQQAPLGHEEQQGESDQAEGNEE